MTDTTTYTILLSNATDLIRGYPYWSDFGRSRDGVLWTPVVLHDRAAELMKEFKDGIAGDSHTTLAGVLADLLTDSPELSESPDETAVPALVACLRHVFGGGSLEKY